MFKQRILNHKALYGLISMFFYVLFTLKSSFAYEENRTIYIRDTFVIRTIIANDTNPIEMEIGEPVNKKPFKKFSRRFSRHPLSETAEGKWQCTRDRYVKGEIQRGIASWYGNNFHGRMTASGERFNQYANTIAHKTLPYFTKVVVKNPENGKSILATVTDCGPFVSGRIADLSKGVAAKLGINGIAEVIIKVL